MNFDGFIRSYAPFSIRLRAEVITSSSWARVMPT